MDTALTFILGSLSSLLGSWATHVWTLKRDRETAQRRERQDDQQRAFEARERRRERRQDAVVAVVSAATSDLDAVHDYEERHEGGLHPSDVEDNIELRDLSRATATVRLLGPRSLATAAEEVLRLTVATVNGQAPEVDAHNAIDHLIELASQELGETQMPR